MNPTLFADELAKLRTAMRAHHLSPLMSIALATLAFFLLLSSAFLLRALFGALSPQALDHAEWRPPELPVIESIQPTPPNADAQTLMRPVFAKSRRPSPQSNAMAETHVEEVGPSSGLTLGAIIRFGDVNRAYVISSNGSDGEWYDAGQSVEGWTIAEIRPTDVMLKSATRKSQLMLYPDPSKEPTPGAGPPTPQRPAYTPSFAPPPPPPPPGGPLRGRKHAG